MIYSLGCDVAKDEHAVCLLNYDLDKQKWEVVSHRSFKNTPSGSKAMLRWLKKAVRLLKYPDRILEQNVLTLFSNSEKLTQKLST